MENNCVMHNGKKIDLTKMWLAIDALIDKYSEEQRIKDNLLAFDFGRYCLGTEYNRLFTIRFGHEHPWINDVEYRDSVKKTFSFLEWIYDEVVKVENERYNFTKDVNKLLANFEFDEIIKSGKILKKNNEEIIKETLKWLNNYEDSKKSYLAALEKFNKKVYERNCLDDMRLSLELLVKKLFATNKSLENFQNVMGATLKKHNCSTPIMALITSLIKCYTDYQNENIKHNHKIKPNEIEFIIDQTSIIMKFLIKTIEDRPEETNAI